MATQRVKIVILDGFKNYQATLRAVNAQLVLITKLKVLRRAMLSLLDRIVGTVKCVNAKQVIIALVKPQTKPLANLDPTPPTQDLLHALNVHPERMPTFPVLYHAKIVTTMLINPNPML